MKSSIQLSRLAHRKHITYLLCYLLFASEDTGVFQEFNDVFKVSNLMGMELQVLWCLWFFYGWMLHRKAHNTSAMSCWGILLALSCHMPQLTTAQHMRPHTTHHVVPHHRMAKNTSYHITPYHMPCYLSDRFIPQSSSSFVLPCISPKAYHCLWHCFRSQGLRFNSQQWHKIQDFQQRMHTSCRSPCPPENGLFWGGWSQDTVWTSSSLTRMALRCVAVDFPLQNTF